MIIAASAQPGIVRAAKAKSASTTLNEVVVKGAAEDPNAVATTGSKTNTPLRYIPASISVVPKDLVETQGATANVDYAVRNVSGVTQSSSSNYGFFNNYQIRGLNMNFLRDGVPDATTINGYSRTLADVERIEVLKGPGSALYGSGAPGGTVNLISKKPQQKAAYSLLGSYGAFDTYETTADMTGPIVPGKVSYRFIANYYDTDGYRDLERGLYEILPTLRFDFNEDHNLTFDFDFRDIEIVADTYGIPFEGSSLTTRNHLLPVSHDNKYYTPFGKTEQKVLRYSVTDEWRVRDELLLRNNFVVLDRELRLLRNAGGAVATGSSVMTSRSLREQADDVTDYLYQFEPVIDFDTRDVHHKLLLGFEYQYHDVDAWRNTAALPNILDVYNPVVRETSKDLLTFVPNFDRGIKANYESLYVQDQMDLTRKLKLRLGGRFDRFDTKVDSRLNRVRERRVDTPFSGQAGLVYEPVEPTSFYGGIARSQQAILSTESSSPLNTPEGALQYEVGSKTHFFQDRLSFDVSWFHVTRKDFLVTIGADTIPVGKQKTQGVDFETRVTPVAGWNLYANYTYQEARLLKVPLAAGPAVEGNRPTGIPANIVNLWSTYEFQDGFLKGFGFGGGLTYKDSVFINQQNTSLVPSYITADAVLFYRRGWYEFQVNVKNLTDQDYFKYGVNGGALPGEPFGVYGTVRLRTPEAAKVG
ncbi:MAG TPA: TonB-dependent siderophore receptor [Opitutaceae bacterium]|nr:TonB-dependent siderophore receptor [Opitutaceae bacterium]